MKTQLLLSLLFSAATLFGAPIERGFWHLTPDAEAKLAELRAKDCYKRKTEHTAFFSRGQLKYGLEKDYIRRWYDRPLHQDTSFRRFSDRKHLINEKGWLVTVRDVKLTGLDGIATSVGKAGRNDILDRIKLPGGALPILVELPYGRYDIGNESYMAVAAMANDEPLAFRIHGKTVITRYPVIQDLPRIGEFREMLRQKYGDKFIVMPYNVLFPNELIPPNGGPLDAGTIDLVCERLRTILRSTDGLYLSDTSSVWNRRFSPKFYDEVITPIIHAVYSEPEFKDKYLGAHLQCGHENCYRWTYGLDSHGTQFLRDNFASVLKLDPDFVIMPEWDEENENTNFRPMLSSLLSTARVCRYFIAQSRGEAVQPIPGDDLTRPNLALSYRRELAAGEPAEFEILNIPDGSADRRTYLVTLVLCDAEGREIKRFPEREFHGGKLSVYEEIIPASSLVSSRFVIPVLEVKESGKLRRFDTHFTPMYISPDVIHDYRWAKHPLRDLPDQCSLSLSVTRELPDGRIELAGKVRSNRPIRTAEVTEGPDTVYCWSAEPQPRSDEKHHVFELNIQGLNASPWRLNGTITFENMPGFRNLWEKKNMGRGVVICRKNVWTFKNYRCDNWVSYGLFSVPEADVANGIVKIRLGDVSADVPLAAIVRNRVYGVGGPFGANLVFADLYATRYMPEPQTAKEIDFKIIVSPKSRRSRFMLQTIDDRFRVARSVPVSVWKPSGVLRDLTVYERDLDKVTKLQVDSALLCDAKYRFTPEAGSALLCSAGLDRAGILGGYVPQVTGFGNGESSYGSLVCRYLDPRTMPDTREAAPRWLPEEKALKFTGMNFVSLPLQTVPPFCGFDLTMEVKPYGLKGRQGLFSAGVNALELSLEDAVPQLRCFLGNSYNRSSGQYGTVMITGPELKVGEWNTVRVHHTPGETFLEVNGVRGDSAKWCDYLLSPRAGALGVCHRDVKSFFQGEIRTLKITIR